MTGGFAEGEGLPTTWENARPGASTRSTATLRYPSEAPWQTPWRGASALSGEQKGPLSTIPRRGGLGIEDHRNGHPPTWTGGINQRAPGEPGVSLRAPQSRCRPTVAPLHRRPRSETGGSGDTRDPDVVIS